MANLSVEKIGGTSMSAYHAVRDNIILHPEQPYNRIFVVSAYGGVTNDLLEHKKNGRLGVYGLFAKGTGQMNWHSALKDLGQRLTMINGELFEDEQLLILANEFIQTRVDECGTLLNRLQELCTHGHFELDNHLLTVREILASIGEAHSAWNLAHLLQTEGINARFVDLSGWNAEAALPLDKVILSTFSGIDTSNELPIVTGYAHCKENLMNTFDRGYSEMTFSRIAVLTQASEAVIHKEYHLSTADPRLVGEEKVFPIGQTNYDIADQLANLGMEAIHPKAAKGLRQAAIPLRIKNTFEPEHSGTLISKDYICESPRVEIIAGMEDLTAFQVFDQDMMSIQSDYEFKLLDIANRLNCRVVTKDFNANTITYYLSEGLGKIQRLYDQVENALPTAKLSTQKVALVSAMGSDMRVKGLLAKAVEHLFAHGINIEAMHQNPRQVEMQFVVNESDYEEAMVALHEALIEQS